MIEIDGFTKPLPFIKCLNPVRFVRMKSGRYRVIGQGPSRVYRSKKLALASYRRRNKDT